MVHLFICREYPPAAYLPGGIGTYVRQICEALALAGETVHVIGHRWAGAPRLREITHDGRLTVHRVSLDEPLCAPDGLAWAPRPGVTQRALLDTRFPSQAFAWQAGLLAERLIDEECIDIIEAQDWEAPLVHLQSRRAAGLGPRRRPPCIVHLHSSTEMIFEANHWNKAVADHAPALALEALSIRLADAVLAPSHFIARETAARLQFPADRITVIRYPLGPGELVARPPEVWSRAAVCHVGRLELRKGVLEWAQAVARVAAEQPSLRAHFAGGDTPVQVTGEGSVLRKMRKCLPPTRRAQLVFHGNLDATGMRGLQARCSAAVVPSRWENFPYSCMEAMRGGLPVIVAPNGGMAEMVEADRSGWVATAGTPAGLAEALRCALATPAARRREMGHAAAARIQTLCGTDAVLAAQMAFRRGVVERSTTLHMTHRSQSSASLQATVLAHPNLQAAPDLQARCDDVFSQHPACQLIVGWVMLDEGQHLLLPDASRPPLHADDGRIMPLLVLRPALAQSMALPTDRPVPWPDAALADRLSVGLGSAPRAWLCYPGVLGRMNASALAPAPPRPQFSAMALAVLQSQMRLLPWLGRCTAGYRRALVRRVAVAAMARLGRRRAHPAVSLSASADQAAQPGNLPAPPMARGLVPAHTGLVSVVVAAYNAEATLAQTLASVLAQTHRQLELIVVDDGSIDDTPRIVEQIAATDGRVRLVRQVNAGVAAARNHGLRLARGEFLAPLDADDLWAPAKLARMVARLQQAGPGAGMAYCWWATVDGQGAVLDSSPPWREEGLVLQRLAEVNFIGCASVPVFRRSALLHSGPQFGYETRLRDLDAQGCEDWDLLLRVAQHHEVVCVPEVLVGYRRHGGSMSSGCAAMWRSGRLVLAELARRQPAWPPSVCQAGLGQFALHLAGVAFWLGRPLEALGWILRARMPSTVLASLPALARLLARRLLTIRYAAATSLRLDAGQCYDAASLPEPLMPYERILSRRWRGRGIAQNERKGEGQDARDCARGPFPVNVQVDLRAPSWDERA